MGFKHQPQRVRYGVRPQLRSCGRAKRPKATDITDNASLLKRMELMKRLEPQYQNFDSNNKNDKLHLELLHFAFTDSLELMTYAAKDDRGFDKPVYDEYFAASDKAKVKGVFQNAWGGNDKEGAPILNLVIVDNKDFGGDRCGLELNLLAYQSNVDIGGVPHSRLHFCDRAYKKKLIRETKCEDLGSTVSEKMRTIGSIFFHEFTHFDEIGKKSVGTHIADPAYGPLKSKALPKDKALVNADSYTWFALENLWEILCQKQFSGARDQRDDTDAVACNNQVCKID